jgi:hypothetical protein
MPRTLAGATDSFARQLSPDSRLPVETAAAGQSVTAATDENHGPRARLG